eukprot:3941437-Rhodomonas_salina.2
MVPRTQRATYITEIEMPRDQACFDHPNLILSRGWAQCQCMLASALSQQIRGYKSTPSVSLQTRVPIFQSRNRTENARSRIAFRT